jgi:hypothetical protein
VEKGWRDPLALEHTALGGRGMGGSSAMESVRDGPGPGFYNEATTAA